MLGASAVRSLKDASEQLTSGIPTPTAQSFGTCLPPSAPNHGGAKRMRCAVSVRAPVYAYHKRSRLCTHVTGAAEESRAGTPRNPARAKEAGLGQANLFEEPKV